MVAKRQSNIRLSGLTERQIAELASAWGVGKSEAIRICIDRAHGEYARTTGDPAARERRDHDDAD